MGRISTMIEATSISQDDYFIVLDSSANIAKKITVANAFGIPDLGFIPTGESWTFVSFDTDTRIGVVTVPNDATTKYANGMRVAFSQTTGGDKMGIIVKVEATTITMFMHNDTDLENEVLSSVAYSSEYAPNGFDVTLEKWSLEWDAPGAEDETTGLTAYQQLGTSELAIGIGSYRLEGRAYIEWRISGGGHFDIYVALSTSKTTVSDSRMSSRVYEQGVGTIHHDTHNFERQLNLSAETIYYFIGKNTVSGTEIDLRADSYIRATLSYV